MTGYYEINQSTSCNYRFTLHAGNHETLLTSQSYDSKADAETGIASIRKNGQMDHRFERLKSLAGQPYFVLKALNGEIIGTSEMYSSEPARENGIQSVITNSPSIVVKDLCEV